MLIWYEHPNRLDRSALAPQTKRKISVQVPSPFFLYLRNHADLGRLAFKELAVAVPV